MKTILNRNLALLSLVMLFTFQVLAQSPKGFSYQAVIRNSSGQPLGQQSLKLHILLTNNLGTVIHYGEEHTTTTSPQGIANLTIGEGSLKQGTLAGVPWQTGEIYIKIEVDATGTGYQSMGNPTRLNSVPYALFADNTKEIVSQPDATDDAPIFVVKNKDGKIVFAVYQGGVRINVEDSPVVKGARGGFAVGGLSQTKAGVFPEYFRITPDSARIYTNKTIAKGARGGFAVGGLSQTKATIENYLQITADSARIYIDNSTTKGSRGGFAVGGLSQTKLGGSNDFIRITPDSTRIYVSSQTLANTSSLGGFAIKSAENLKSEYFNVSSTPTARKINNESRVMWYPSKSSLLAGEISVLHPDSVGQFSMSLGYRNIAKGSYSQAMGYKSIARGNNSTAIGFEAVAGESAFSFGNGSKALGLGSFAFGAKGVDVNGVIQDISTEATGAFSFAFGLGSKAKAIGSFVLGVNCESSAKFAIATGFGSKASGANATAMGLNTEASGANSFASGSGSKATALNSTSIGVNNTSSGIGSFTLGSGNNATSPGAFALGEGNDANGFNSLALGKNNTATGVSSIVGGEQNTATGDYSFAIGTYNQTIGLGSISVGSFNTSNGVNSATIGESNTSGGQNSLAIGFTTTATGGNSLAMGNTTQALAENSLALGNSTITSGANSLALGEGTTAKAYSSIAIGKYNTVVGNSGVWTPTDPLLVAGNGTSSTPSNAMVLYKNGNLAISGALNLPIVTLTTATTLGATHYTVLANAAITITLPNANTCSGRVYVIKKIIATGSVTLASAGGTIDGASTQTLTTQYQKFAVQSDGTNWYIIN